jgi:serine/threonine protein kinase
VESTQKTIRRANDFSRFPYNEETILHLRLESKTDLDVEEDNIIRCKVSNYFEPSTLSCVMEVQLLGQSESKPKRAVLKMFDRRFASQLRSDHRVGRLTVETETVFRDFVKSGDLAQFLEYLRDEEDFSMDEKDWTIGEDETNLQNICLDMYTSEAAVYQKLEDLQGNQIPRLFAQVRLQAMPKLSPSETISSEAIEFLEIKGVLLEFIDGCTLSEMPSKIPREDWGDICHQAVQVVRLLDDYSILNRDVRPSNVMVTRSVPDKYRVVMLDFGQCIFRQPEDTDKQWGRRKWTMDEEGAIGKVMEHRLKKLGYDSGFVHSFRFLKWAEGEFPSDGED